MDEKGFEVLVVEALYEISETLKRIEKHLGKSSSQEFLKEVNRALSKKLKI